MKIQIRDSFVKYSLILSILINIFLFIYFITNDNVKKSHYYLQENKVSLLSKDQQTLIKAMIDSGSQKAYNELFIFYMDNKEPGEFLPWALLMANKWGYSYNGMYDVYMELLNMYSLDYKNIDKMDSITRSMALSYLIMAYETGDSTEKSLMFDPDIKYYLEEGYFVESEGKLMLK